MSNHSDRLPAGTQSSSVSSDGECSALILDPSAVARVRDGLADDSRTAATAAIFSALADPTRVRILDALGIEELCVCDLAEISGISQSGVSHQLRMLRDLGIVRYRREGNRAVYHLADDHVRNLLAQGFEHADEGGDPR